MGAPYLALRADQGTAFPLGLTYAQPDGVTPVNLTGATAVVTIWEPGTGRVIAEQTVTGLGATGRIDALFADTSSWPPGRSTYTVDLTLPGADPTRILAGALDVKEPHRA